VGERGHRWAGGPAIGSDTIVMSDPVYVGIAVTSHDAGAMTTAVADDVSQLRGDTLEPAADRFARRVGIRHLRRFR